MCLPILGRPGMRPSTPSTTCRTAAIPVCSRSFRRPHAGGRPCCAKRRPGFGLLYYRHNIYRYREDYTNPVINQSDPHDLSRRFPRRSLRRKISETAGRQRRAGGAPVRGPPPKPKRSPEPGLPEWIADRGGGHRRACGPVPVRGGDLGSHFHGNSRASRANGG